MKKPDSKLLRLADINLPKAQIESLKSIVAGAKQAKQLCLFIGPRGSGQLLVAKVLATELGQTLKRAKFSTLFGESAEETEKNLLAVLEKAQAARAILLFDEADALFGVRSEVKDSHDRYANQEVSHLLEALNTYRGLVILSSNLKVEEGAALAGRSAHVLTFDQNAD